MTRDELLALIDRAAEEGWTELDLSNQDLTEIPAEIGGLTNLTSLCLVCNQLEEIPESITRLTNLTTLDFSANWIEEIPESIGRLTNLTGLYLFANQITKIPESFGRLTNLTGLYLAENQITELPESIGRLTNLIELNLSQNEITEIPESIGRLTNLTALDLSENEITEIPESICRLTNLTGLDLGGNQITEIPESIVRLTKLTRLDLSRSQITKIPESIGRLINLAELYLYGNRITEIPESITQLTNLTALVLFGNEIREIPESIGRLTNLTTLVLSSNRITEIPESIESLPTLNILDLRWNPLPISPEILGSFDYTGSVQEIFNYLRQLQSGEVRPLNEAKLILVGQGSVGKTSLIKRLVEGTFDPGEPQTDGLSVNTWNVHVNSKDVRLNVWDFGGQEIYHATHQFFLTKRSLYLLVCNCRTSEEENRLEYWLKLIESFGDKSPVIIVGNKKDEQPLDINRKALQEKYPNIRGIIETSCQSGEGIEELRAVILQEVGQLKEVYDLLPLSWFEVKEQLEGLEEDFISYNEYIGICYGKNIPEEKNQEQLIDLLHRLGLVLNFREHQILKSTNVLKPDWVTEGIYALLSDETLKTKTKGMLTYTDLDRVLDPNRYPSDRHHYLIDLMQEFQLCFAISDCHPKQFLIPGLLPKEEPQNTYLGDETLEFQYHYRVLPESILSRFIVLTHEKIHDRIYWRTGVMLAYRENGETYNLARVKADPEEKKIFISINGREPTRRVFLCIIRDVFNKIHNSFANLELTEHVPVPGHPDHPPPDYQELLGLEEMGEKAVVIGKLKLRIDLRKLLDGYESREDRQKRRQSESNSPNLTININNTNQQGDYKPMTEITNNNQGANIGNLVNQAKDNVTIAASNFTQTSGINSDELLKIIADLRQIVTRFPLDKQEEIIIDIEDIEEQIKKPENQRSIPRLRRSLVALLTTASVIAAPVANIADFTNNVTDLGAKLGIELLKNP